MSSPAHPVAAELVAEAAARGFNLVGFVRAPQFDACQPTGRRTSDRLPDCGTVFLLGCGGTGLWSRLSSATNGGFGTAAPDHHPIDDYSAAACAELCAWLAERDVPALVTRPDDPDALNFMHLAEMAGWGTISPVMGILLHPQYGPWVSMRAAMLLGGEPFGVVDGEEQQLFQPCLSCAKPCVDACPVHVYDGVGGVDLETCARHRHGGHCRDGCDARRACPVGADERYGPDEERFRHAYSLFSMRRHFGFE